MTGAQAPQGWYPAGEDGVLRWWDGEAWTDHRAEGYAAKRPGRRTRAADLSWGFRSVAANVVGMATFFVGFFVFLGMGMWLASAIPEPRPGPATVIIAALTLIGGLLLADACVGRSRRKKGPSAVGTPADEPRTGAGAVPFFGMGFERWGQLSPVGEVVGAVLALGFAGVSLLILVLVTGPFALVVFGAITLAIVAALLGVFCAVGATAGTTRVAPGKGEEA